MRTSFVGTGLVFAALLAGCGGIEEQDFVDQYNARWCEHRLACDDEALLTFEGIVDQKSCEEANYATVANWGYDGCMYDPAQALQCLTDVETLPCSPQGGVNEPPPSCDTVYRGCPESPAGETTDSETTE